MARPNRIHEAGVTLIELLIALVVLSVGLLALSQLFPEGTRSQQRDQKLTSATKYSQAMVEKLQGRTWTDSLLTVGRHPAGTAVEYLESGTLERWYQVDAMAAPLDNLKKVTVTVRYRGSGQGRRSVSTVTYVRR